MTVDEASALVRLRCEQRLGHLGEVILNIRDCGAHFGVGIRLATGWRHAVVGGDTRDAVADPVGFADRVSDKLLDWLETHSLA